MPPPPRILDSHIHLWPHTSTNPTGHAWMAPGGPLTKQYSLTSSTPPRVRGAVYVETDRTLANDAKADILVRAAQPLEELRWLRRLVTGTPAPGEGFAPGDGAVLWGLVPWIPVDVGLADLRAYLAAAEEAAGPEAWARVVGWRFLVQGIKDEEAFGRVVGGWTEALREVGRRGWCFDVGVDARSGGVWQVERAVEACERVNDGGDGVREGEEVRFILNHLCKPDMEQHPTTPAQRDAFDRWSAAIRRAARSPHTYMKLSGAFSEIADQDPSAPWTPERVLERMKPWLDVLFSAFPPERIMFGSDWPVCNVRGPGDARAWSCWAAAVEKILDAYGLTEEQRDRVWYGTAVEAYRLSPPKA
ncbi:Amidohydrolase [Lasiodiplodia theobromae]|uniref:Amidohydrolase n=1 Tax=Lasiodiplodia theobromae TaxID=45133 RepID=UPI0015C40741|nr:Amidohydrolase [Lasiodiplodia theobromae]KAF4545628.1 Amidohydrolase [Lasiodiplodia theobromae]